MANDDLVKKRFGDIWFRARHNALANDVAAHEYRRKLLLIDMLIAELIVSPMLSTVFYQQGLIDYDYHISLSALSGLGALYLSLVGFVRDWRANLDNHKRAHAIFNNIAQKARRGENQVSEEEIKYLLRSLEEMFETAKYNLTEPSDNQYNRGMVRMTNMPKWPYDLDIEKYRKSRTIELGKLRLTIL